MIGRQKEGATASYWLPTIGYGWQMGETERGWQMAEEITYTGANIRPEFETLRELWLVTEWRDDHGVKAVYKTEKIGKAWVPMGATQGKRGEDTICVASLSTNDPDTHINPRRKA